MYVNIENLPIAPFIHNIWKTINNKSIDGFSKCQSVNNCRVDFPCIFTGNISLAPVAYTYVHMCLYVCVMLKCAFVKHIFSPFDKWMNKWTNQLGRPVSPSNLLTSLFFSPSLTRLYVRSSVRAAQHLSAFETRYMIVPTSLNIRTVLYICIYFTFNYIHSYYSCHFIGQQQSQHINEYMWVFNQKKSVHCMYVFMFACVYVMYGKLLHQMFTYVGAEKVLVP